MRIIDRSILATRIFQTLLGWLSFVFTAALAGITSGKVSGSVWAHLVLTLLAATFHLFTATCTPSDALRYKSHRLVDLGLLVALLVTSIILAATFMRSGILIYGYYVNPLSKNAPLQERIDAAMGIVRFVGCFMGSIVSSKSSFLEFKR